LVEPSHGASGAVTISLKKINEGVLHYAVGIQLYAGISVVKNLKK